MNTHTLIRSTRSFVWIERSEPWLSAGKERARRAWAIVCLHCRFFFSECLIGMPEEGLFSDITRIYTRHDWLNLLWILRSCCELFVRNGLKAYLLGSVPKKNELDEQVCVRLHWCVCPPACSNGLQVSGDSKREGKQVNSRACLDSGLQGSGDWEREEEHVHSRACLDSYQYTLHDHKNVDSIRILWIFL